MNPKQVKIVYFNDLDNPLEGLLKNELKVTGLPVDANIVDVFREEHRQRTGIKIRSDEFDKVQEGDEIPVLHLSWEVVQDWKLVREWESGGVKHRIQYMPSRKGPTKMRVQERDITWSTIEEWETSSLEKWDSGRL